MSEVNQKSIHAGPAQTTSTYQSTDVGTISMALGSNKSQLGYKTASHVGLHSNYHTCRRDFEMSVVPSKKIQETNYRLSEISGYRPEGP